MSTESRLASAPAEQTETKETVQNTEAAVKDVQSEVSPAPDLSGTYAPVAEDALGSQTDAPVQEGQDPAEVKKNWSFRQKKKGEHVAEDASVDNEASPAIPAGNSLEKLHFRGLILVLFFLCLQVVPDLYHAFQGTALFCPAETSYINSYLSGKTHAEWFAPVGYVPASWPGFYWLTSALSLCCPSEIWLFTLSALIGSALCLMAVWYLCRHAGYEYSAATAAGLLLLSAPLFTPLVHFYGPQALASALFLFSLIFLSRGWRGDGSWFSLPLGFILVGLAGLTGGLFHLLLPLLSSLVFLVWCGRYRRAQRTDAVFGFFCLLALLGGWLGYMYVSVKDAAYIHDLFHHAIRIPWPLNDWWIPLLLVVGGSLPWILAWIFPSWLKVCSQAWNNLKASQKEHAGSTFIWINLALGLGLILCMPTSVQPGCAITLICLLSALLGKTIVRLTKTGARLFLTCCMLFLLACAAVLLFCYLPVIQSNLAPFLPWMPPAGLLTTTAKLHALPILAAICFLASIYIRKFWKNGDTGGLMIAAAVITTLLTIPVTVLLVPALADEPLAHLKTLSAIHADQGTTKPAAPKGSSAPTEAKGASKDTPAQAKPQDTPKGSSATIESKDASKDTPAQAKPQDTPKGSSAPTESKDASKDTPAQAKDADAFNNARRPENASSGVSTTDEGTADVARNAATKALPEGQSSKQTEQTP